MPRYIDADALKETIENAEYFDYSQIDDAPTADVVEVVRCKDCRKWCICHHGDDYFCADGERREEE